MKRLNSGDIVEVFLEPIRKYCYLKFVDKREYYNSINCPFQFRVSKFVVDDKLDSVCDIDFSDLFISPWHLMGHNELLKTGRWNIVGNQKLLNSDFVQHHYKMVWPPNLLADPLQVKQWRVLKNIDNVNEGILVSYEKCKHLEYCGNHGALNLEQRVIIEQLKIEGRLDTIEKINWDKYDHILFQQFKYMPINTQLPSNITGHLIE